MRFGLLSTYVAAIAVVTWREVKVFQRTPEPKHYVRVAIVWGILGVVSELGVPELAALFGLGFVLAMLYDFYANNGVGLAEGENPITPIDETSAIPTGPTGDNPFL